MNKSVNKKGKPKMKSIRRKSPYFRYGRKQKTKKTKNRSVKKIYGGETEDVETDEKGNNKKVSPKKNKEIVPSKDNKDKKMEEKTS